MDCVPYAFLNVANSYLPIQPTPNCISHHSTVLFFVRYELNVMYILSTLGAPRFPFYLLKHYNFQIKSRYKVVIFLCYFGRFRLVVITDIERAKNILEMYGF